MNEKINFLQLVKDQIKSMEAKKAVELELAGHIEETAKFLISGGLTREEAEAKAVRQMGDPVKIGARMGQLHRPKVDWNLLWLFIILHLIGFIPILVTGWDYQPSLIDKAGDVLLGFLIVLVLMMFDYRKLKEKPWLLMGTAAVALIVFKKYQFQRNIVLNKLQRFRKKF